MIRYATQREGFDFYNRLEAEHPRWMQRALQAKPTDAIWNELRKLYFDLQGGKCAYCERQLTDVNRAGGHDKPVDHFRPKGEVKEWRSKQDRLQGYETGKGCRPGYRLLAHEPMNYALSCVTCNSSLKKCFFPVAGKRQLNQRKVRKLASEGPLLLYPIGDMDDDPEGLLCFDGFQIQATSEEGTHDWLRAEVTMELFALGPDGLSRDELIDERCREIDRAYRTFEAGDDLSSFQRLEQIHANCVRCFLRLCKKNPRRAARIHDLAKKRLASRGR